MVTIQTMTKTFDGMFNAYEWYDLTKLPFLVLKQYIMIEKFKVEILMAGLLVYDITNVNSKLK